MDIKLLFDIAKEAIKPASAVIDALIKPKVIQVGQWANEKNLRGRVENVQLNIEDVFDSYLKRLLRRVSGIKTIVFSQHVLPLPEIYEPVTVSTRDNGTVVSEAELLTDGVHSYLIDSAGMGKSTFVKHLIFNEIVNGDRIPLFLELRRIVSGESLIEAIARDLDDSSKKFDRDVLTRLLSVGSFLIVLDGFDEVSTVNRKDLARQIEELGQVGERHTIILTSRPFVDLPMLPNAAVLSFVPLTREQSASLVQRYDTVGGLDVGSRLVKKFKSVPNEFVQTPLLVTLLYLVYWTNNSISPSITAFYEELFIALFKGHDATKVEFTREKLSNLDCDSFRRLFRGVSFLAIAQQINSFRTNAELTSIIDKAIQLTGIKPFTNESYRQDLLTGVPLLVRDGTEYRFIHKTIAEFFAAEYIAYEGDSKKILSQIGDNKIVLRYAEVLKFLNGIQPKIFRENIVAKVAQEVLNHKPSTHPLIRSITFFGKAKLGVFTNEDFDNPSAMYKSAGFDIEQTSLSAYDTKGKHTLVWIRRRTNYLGSLCLESISKRRKLDISVAEDISEAIDRLATVIPVGEWFSVDDPVIEHHIQDPTVYELLADILSNFVGIIRFSHTDVPLLDDDQSIQSLKQIEEEMSAQDWLNDLIMDASKTAGEEEDRP